MMDLPRHKQTMTLRRHHTSPSTSSAGRSVIAPVSVGRRITRQSSLNYRTIMKSNPYVGWFRHSPPTTPHNHSAAAAAAAKSVKTWQKNKYVPLWRRSATATTVPSSLSACKNSPHIGWFRHAPPSSFDLTATTSVATTTTSSNDCCLGGDSFKEQELLLNLLQQLNPALDRVQLIGKDVLALSQACDHAVVSTGYLRGGGKEYLEGTRNHHHISRRPFVKDLRESSAEGTLSTVNALSRLASWFLFPVAHDAESCGYRQDAYPEKKKSKDDGILSHLLSPYLPTFLEEPLPPIPNDSYYKKYGNGIIEDDEAEMNCDRKNDDDDSDASSDCDSVASSIASPPLPSSKFHFSRDLSLSVSSLAEAYYAHQSATKDMMGATEPLMTPHLHTSAAVAPSVDGGGSVSPHRLDYVITQMDIARMSRNASRHLDVQSILSLPVITYKKPTTTPSSTTTTKLLDQYQGWSWTIVEESDGRKEVEALDQVEKEKVDFCVICLEHFADGDRLRVLPCDHSFHVGCIDRWLSGSQSFEECYTSGCPTCKKRPNISKPTRSQSLCEPASSDDNNNMRGDIHRSGSLDGSVPSWAFAQIGSALVAQQEQEQGTSICSGSSSSP